MDVVCRLPPADRTRRTAEFRALLAGATVDRERVAGGVRWTLEADATMEAESRRLAELEARCCDGIRFAVHRRGNRVVWEITGPPGAEPTLDAFYELPLLVHTDDGAARLWAALDRVACGPPATLRSAEA